jgi:hypothetical protein
MSFRKGAELKFVSMRDSNWWLAEDLTTNMSGTIPSNYVVRLPGVRINACPEYVLHAVTERDYNIA